MHSSPHIIHYVAFLLCTLLKYSPAQSATIPLHLPNFGESTEDLINTPKREIRQVVPTSYKPICKPNERLNIRNECVPNRKLPAYSPKTKRPSADFFVSHSTPPTLSLSTSENSSPTPGTKSTVQQQFPTSSTLLDVPRISTTQSVQEDVHSSELYATVVMHTLKEFLSQKTEKYVETTTFSSVNKRPTIMVKYDIQSSAGQYTTKSSTTTESPSTRPPSESTLQTTPHFIRKHKCYSHHDHSSEKIVSSAYEDYDY